MARHIFSIKQQQIIRALVKADPSCSFMWQNEGGERFQLLDQRTAVAATKADMKSLEAHGIIKVDGAGPGAFECGLRSAAFAAVQNQFGLTGWQRFLQANYELARESKRPLYEVGEAAGLSQPESGEAWQYCAQRQYVGGHAFGVEGGWTRIEPDGVAAWEEMRQGRPEATGVHIQNLTVGAYQHGANASATVTQNIGGSSQSESTARQLQALREKAQELEQQQWAMMPLLQTIVEILDHEPSTPGLAERLAKVAELAKPFVELFGAVAKLAEELRRK